MIKKTIRTLGAVVFSFIIEAAKLSPRIFFELKNRIKKWSFYQYCSKKERILSI